MELNKNVVLMPCFDRPEFFYWSTRFLLKAVGAENYHYVFLMDYGFSKLHLDIIHGKNGFEPFPHSFEVVETRQSSFGMMKQSYNVLGGWNYAAGKSKEYVILVEDDVMVANDFFHWHESMQMLNSFAVLSTENHNRKLDIDMSREDAFYFSTGDYCSLGVSMHKKTIKEHILPHCNLNYYKRPVDYCVSKFPNSSIGKFFAEQDGLIRRIQEHSNLLTIYPYTPRAYHAGFYGKNRKQNRPGIGLHEKIERIAQIIFSDEAMKRNALNPHFYTDSRPINLTRAPVKHFVSSPIPFT